MKKSWIKILSITAILVGPVALASTAEMETNIYLPEATYELQNSAAPVVQADPEEAQIMASDFLMELQSAATDLDQSAPQTDRSLSGE